MLKSSAHMKIPLAVQKLSIDRPIDLVLVPDLKLAGNCGAFLICARLWLLPGNQSSGRSRLEADCATLSRPLCANAQMHTQNVNSAHVASPGIPISRAPATMRPPNPHQSPQGGGPADSGQAPWPLAGLAARHHYLCALPTSQIIWGRHKKATQSRAQEPVTVGLQINYFNQCVCRRAIDRMPKVVRHPIGWVVCSSGCFFDVFSRIGRWAAWKWAQRWEANNKYQRSAYNLLKKFQKFPRIVNKIFLFLSILYISLFT